MAATPATPAAAAPAADPDADQGADDLSKGYVVELSCMPDGTYSVSGPEPLSEEQSEESAGGDAGSDADDQGQTFDSIGAALKGVLDIIKQNPMSGNDQDQFNAGYAGK